MAGAPDGMDGKVPTSGRPTFKLEKTIDLTNVDDSYRAFCCALTSASSSTFQIAVPTFSKRSSKVYVFSLDGTQNLTITTSQDRNPRISHPWDVTMSAEGLLYYITDGKPWVKVYNKEGNFKHLFQLADLNGKTCTTGSSRGITIDNKGQIIVGDCSNKIISIYKSDESFVNAFKVDINPHYVTTKHSDDDVILVSTISMAGMGSVLEIDYSGKVLNTITSPIENMIWEPFGICCSNMGEIFVVNGADGHGCVCGFTSMWQGCVLSDLENPRGIDISEDGELMVVVDNEGTQLKIFRRS